MITRSAYAGYEGWLYLVVQCLAQSRRLRPHREQTCRNVHSLQRGMTMALVALQGPKAEAVLAKLGSRRARYSVHVLRRGFH